MSSRTYNLRNRLEAGIATQLTAPSVSTLPRPLTPPVRDLPPHMPGGPPQNDSPVALYSDIVASRSPSPLKETSTATTHHTAVEPNAERPPIGGSGPGIKNVPVSKDAYDVPTVPNKPVISPQDPGDEPWTTVRRRRARSLESLDPIRSYSGSLSAKDLTPDQVRMVQAATENLTNNQKRVLSNRQRKVAHQRMSSSSSRGEGPSKPKGKGVDPREWGGVNISQESLDVEAQAAAWQSLTHGKKAEQSARTVMQKGERYTNRSDHRSPSVRLPAASRPVAQLAQDSYLGMALRNVSRPSYRKDDGGPSSPSDPGSSSDEFSDSGSSSSSDERSHHRRKSKHSHHRRWRRRSPSSSRKLVIKPIAPKEYDGSADARAYHRFVRESEAYLRDGKVRGRRRIFLLSYYLTGKGYDFYTQKVANDEDNWSLRQFYNELFNYCFPVDYRMQLRRKLARCHQNDKTVAEYTHELNELFNMIGDIPERDQVIKFWNGSRPIIQKGLWRDNLNPEISLWAHVVAQAEIIEISENVAERRDKRSGFHSQKDNGPSGFGSAKSKARDGDRSVRSVSFDNTMHTSRQGDRFHKSPYSGSRGQSSRGKEGSQASRGRSQTPRSISSHVRSTPKLSDKEKAERKAAGQCFVCGASDHFSRDCPTKKVVRASGDRPPGASSFNIEPSLAEEDSDGVEVLESLPVGAISVAWEGGTPGLIDGEMDVQSWPLDGWRERYPYWCQPNILARRPIGDSYAMIADSILTLAQPYPGDEQYQWGSLGPEMRFIVRKRGALYRIDDLLVDKQVLVEPSLLKRPPFNLSHWYAIQRVKALSLNKRTIPTYNMVMGSAVSIVARKLLTDGIHTYYPCRRTDINPDFRFEVCQRKVVPDEYIITDKDLRIHVRIPQSALENPSFDLVGWYIAYLSSRDLYGSQDLGASTRRCCTGDHPPVGCTRNARDTHLGAPEPSIAFEKDEEGRPDLIALSDDSDADSADDDFEKDNFIINPDEIWEDTFVLRLSQVLTECQPFPGDGTPVDPTFREGDNRFVITFRDSDTLEIYDRLQGFEAYISARYLQWERFSVGRWFAERCAVNSGIARPWEIAQEWLEARSRYRTTMGFPAFRENFEYFVREMTLADEVELGGIQVDRNKYPSLQRNAAQVKGNGRLLPKPIVVKMEINGHPARALLDSGSLGDFISSTLVDQLSITREPLSTPLSLHLAVQGSRSKVNASVSVKLKYQGIDDTRTLDIINLNNYDLILGTPFMFQHKICLGFNPARVVIGSDVALPMKAGFDTKLLVSMLSPDERQMESVREELRRYADPLCKDMEETDLPPLRAINHTIPLIDESKIYSWRPSRCPEVFRAQWVEKRDAYIRSGRWKITSAGNTVPMLLIQKPGTNPPLLRTVVDLRERNKNTHRMTSPLPDIDGVLRRTASKPFRTSLDLKNAYEQIRIIPEHVNRSAVTTPDGNMVSLVAQQGDCNAPATYQALMNYLFSSYIGRFMDVYLDDIVIYSDTLEEHVKHVKIVLDILLREKLYLSSSKLHFLALEMSLLGRVIDNDGIRMDANKVDSVVTWKVPTNRDLLRGFIGSVGYLADDIPNVRIPLGILSSITGDTVPFRWGYTEQRAFDEVKALVHAARNHRRAPLDYSPTAPPIWMVTDGCATGVSGVVSQGPEWKTARIAAFYSAKLNSAQQNYPVHEIEMLAGVETMLRYADILQGIEFKWLTDHKGLTHLLNQKNLSGRQARWLEKISSFSFTVVYVEGSENVVADALSRIYSNDSPGTERFRSEFTYHDVVDDDTMVVDDTDVLPVLAGIEARVATRRGSRVRRLTERAAAGLASAPKIPDVKNRLTLGVHQEGGRKAVVANPPAPSYKPTLDAGVKSSGREAVVANPPATTQEQERPAEGPDLPLLTQSSLGIDILSELRGKYGGDTMFRTILEKPNEYRNFEVKDQLIYLKDSDKMVLCIPKVLIQGRSSRELVISEAHSMLAHLGASKTLDYLRDNVWWKDIVTDVKAFCETCQTCKMSKPNNQKPYGLLNPLGIPSYPWESVGIDFVGPLPESRNRDGQFDSITVVICLLTAMVHLIPSRTNYNASQLAELVFDHIYKIHGLPQNIISDRDVLFTSTFWTRLHRLLGTKLRMSSAYHPQSDGSTEHANRTITQMLRQCIQPDQRDWVSRLPAIEFAINSARSESTGYAPFFLNFGRMPRAMVWASVLANEYPAIRDFAMSKKLALMSAHDSIIAARVKQTRDANRKRQDVPFQAGDLVYLSSNNISFKKGLARKLLPKFLGPYKILKDYGNSSFQLELPLHLTKRGVHDVFHSSLLRIHVPNDDRLFPGRMDTQLAGEDDGDEWAVDRILSHHGSSTEATFEILWKSGDVTWLPYYQITHLQALTDYLELLKVRKITKLPKGRGRPPSDDPQLFVGSIDIVTPTLSVSAFLSAFLRSSPFNLNATFSSLSSFFLSFFPTTFVSPTIDLEHLSFFDMPLRGVDHPRFTRIAPTHYLLRNSSNFFNLTVHVGQIADFLNFEKSIRTQGGLVDLKSMPLGYLDFAELWNSRTYEGDPRRLSYYSYSENAEEPTTHISPVPVALESFYITQQQVGLPLKERRSQSQPIRFNEHLLRECATVMVDNRRFQDPKTQYEKRQERRHWKQKSFKEHDGVLSRLNFRAQGPRASAFGAMAPNTQQSSSTGATNVVMIPITPHSSTSISPDATMQEPAEHQSTT